MEHNILQESHLKDTRRRRAVLHVLENSDSPLSVLEKKLNKDTGYIITGHYLGFIPNVPEEIASH